MKYPTVSVNGVSVRADDQGRYSLNDLHASAVCSGQAKENRKRAARTVLTGMCYSVGSATRQGSSSPTRFIGQSAMTSRA